MDSLTELYNTAIVPADEELEKQAAEMEKQAAEEEAAGRIMARGFASELNKLAAPAHQWPKASGGGPSSGSGTIKTKPGYDTGSGATAPTVKTPKVVGAPKIKPPTAGGGSTVASSNEAAAAAAKKKKDAATLADAW